MSPPWESLAQRTQRLLLLLNLPKPVLCFISPNSVLILTLFYALLCGCAGLAHNSGEFIFQTDIQGLNSAKCELVLG